MLKFKLMVVGEGISLQAAVQMGQQPFTALITYAGRTSDNFVGGTEGIDGGPYHVLIPPDLLRRKIQELEGKRVFASDDLQSHQKTMFIGEFVSAWIEELDNGLVAAKASGVLYRHTNPELVDKIVAEARRGQMGFSYDLKDVRYELKNGQKSKELSASSESPFIEVTDFQWRGATILKREAAAYLETQLAASKVDKQSTTEGEAEMDKAEILKAVGEGMQAALKDYQAEFLASTIEPLKTELSAGIAAVKQEISELKGKQTQLEASLASGSSNTGDHKDDKKEGDSKSSAPTLTAADLANAVKAALIPITANLTEAVDGLKSQMAGDVEKKGFRKSLAASHFDVLHKYSGVQDEGDVTPEAYQRAIETVQTDIRLGRDAKCKILAELSAAKRTLIRAEEGGR